MLLSKVRSICWLFLDCPWLTERVTTCLIFLIFHLLVTVVRICGVSSQSFSASVPWYLGASGPLNHGASASLWFSVSVPRCFGGSVPWYLGASGSLNHGASVSLWLVSRCLGALVVQCLCDLVSRCLGASGSLDLGVLLPFDRYYVPQHLLSTKLCYSVLFNVCFDRALIAWSNLTDQLILYVRFFINFMFIFFYNDVNKSQVPMSEWIYLIVHFSISLLSCSLCVYVCVCICEWNLVRIYFLYLIESSDRWFKSCRASR